MKSIARKLMSNEWLNLKSEIHRFLLLSTAFSVLMVLMRIAIIHQYSYRFLIWNLFLGAIPYGISRWLQLNPHLIKRRFLFAGLLIVWVLFLPNSFYILTDLFHLTGYYGMKKWFDLTMIVSFAWNGMLLGILSIREMEKIMHTFLGRRTLLFFIYPVMLLCAFGIYLGRFLRFNSWDVITNPFGLFSDMGSMIFNPFDFHAEWITMICFSTLMTLIYLSIKKIARTIN